MYRFPVVALSAPWKGRSVDLNTTQVWDADDPFVKAHPEFFSHVPPVLERSDGAIRRTGVEEATARPGEKRHVVR